MSPNPQVACYADSLSLFRDSLLHDEALPLAAVLDSGLFAEACAQFEFDFVPEEEAVYTPALVLWALVSQVLYQGEHRRLTAAVTRIAVQAA